MTTRRVSLRALAGLVCSVVRALLIQPSGRYSRQYDSCRWPVVVLERLTWVPTRRAIGRNLERTLYEPLPEAKSGGVVSMGTSPLAGKLDERVAAFRGKPGAHWPAEALGTA